MEGLLSRSLKLESARLDILKVAHHGSKSSTSVALLRRLRPRLGLISCGVDNRYHHPSSVVLDRLRRYRVPVLRTDRQGQIGIKISDDGGLRIDWIGR